MRSPAAGEGDAEEFFRSGEYWRAWSRVPDLTADIPYALTALRAEHRTVLDVPCGHGRLLRAVAARRPDVRLVGLDVNRDMIRQARESVPRASTAVASVYDLPFRDRSFDLVLCHQSFMHFDDPVEALRELTRVARCDVYLSVTTRRQLNTLLRRLGLLGSGDAPHWTYNIEDLRRLLPAEQFVWRVTGAFLVGAKALRLSPSAHLRAHHLVGRHLPQWLARRFGQSLFVYGRRRRADDR